MTLLYILVLMFAFGCGWAICALLSVTSKAELDSSRSFWMTTAQNYKDENFDLNLVIDDKDKIIRNQKLKIAEQAEKICNLKDSVSYLESPNEN